MTRQRAEAAQHWAEKWALRECSWSLLKTQNLPCPSPRYADNDGRKGESIDIRVKNIYRGRNSGRSKEGSRRVELRPGARCRALIRGTKNAGSERRELSRWSVRIEIYAVAIKERSAKRAERSDASLFDDSVNKLRRRVYLEKKQWTDAMVSFYLPLIIYYYFTPSPHSVAFCHLMR